VARSTSTTTGTDGRDLTSLLDERWTVKYACNEYTDAVGKYMTHHVRTRTHTNTKLVSVVESWVTHGEDDVAFQPMTIITMNAGQVGRILRRLNVTDEEVRSQLEACSISIEWQVHTKVLFEVLDNW
jgi:hypothetical protein